MNAAYAAIAELERLCSADLRSRDTASLVEHTRGQLLAAARSIAEHPSPHVGIITGFFLADAETPNCETDGPPGAVTIADALSGVGVPCRIATDRVNAHVLHATAAAGRHRQSFAIDIISMSEDGSDGHIPLPALCEAWRNANPAISHVISIERCGPSADGPPRNARSQDMSAVNAPLERLFQAGSWTTIGIGDLGNELGMGSLPRKLVAALVPEGSRLWCPVPCDHPIFGSISNLAASALVGALALLRTDWSDRLLAHMTPGYAFDLLQAAVVDGGAVSIDIHGKRQPFAHVSVDGLPWSIVERIYREMQDACSKKSHAGRCGF